MRFFRLWVFCQQVGRNRQESAEQADSCNNLSIVMCEEVTKCAI